MGASEQRTLAAILRKEAKKDGMYAVDPVKTAGTNLSTRAATSFWYPVSILAEAVRGAGLLDSGSVIEGVSARPELYDIPGTQEWMQRQIGGDPLAEENILADLGTPDPYDLARYAPELGMIVFHGSPHQWDKPDLSKVGTGEGAQAYGHGFYVAENPEVAKEYVVKGQQGIGSINRYHGQALPDEAWTEIAPIMQKHGMPGDIMPNQTQAGMVRGLLDDYGTRLSKAERATLEKWANPEGHLYELDLPDETIAKMLDWDKPLSEQPEILAAMDKLPEYGPADVGDMTGAEFYEYLSKEYMERPKDSLFTQLLGKRYSDKYTQQEAASAFLNKAGIPGIRYLDGTSRTVAVAGGGKPRNAAGGGWEIAWNTPQRAVFKTYEEAEKALSKLQSKGTRNFVVFDEKYLTPLKRDGKPIKGK